MGVKFKTHETPEGHTRDVVIRVSEIDNGYVIKAGGPPHHVTTAAELREKVDEILAGFTAPKEKKQRSSPWCDDGIAQAQARKRRQQ